MNEQQILKRAEKIVDFKTHVFSYVVVNLFLIGLNLYHDNTIDWAFFPLFGWGIGLFSHYISVYNRLFSVEREAEKLRNKHRDKRT